MTLDTEPCIDTPAETAATPAAHTAEHRGYRLFQTMDELRARHGTITRMKHRLLHAAAALAGGSLLFAALYAIILFLE